MNKEMNYKEMLSALFADYLDCIKFNKSISKKVKQRISQATIYPVNLGPVEFETKSKRKYLIYITGYSKKDCLDPFVTIVNYNETTVGYRANMITLGLNGINVISYFENVFKSYKDYYYEDTASEFEVLKEFFKTNSTNMSQNIDNKLILQCKDGLLTGFKQNEMIKVMHSFTPNDLIENELKSLRDIMLNDLDQIVELKMQSKI
jgi:hypothetical protein